jgi:hypothetical protein
VQGSADDSANGSADGGANEQDRQEDGTLTPTRRSRLTAIYWFHWFCVHSLVLSKVLEATARLSSECTTAISFQP